MASARILRKLMLFYHFQVAYWQLTVGFWYILNFDLPTFPTPIRIIFAILPGFTYATESNPAAFYRHRQHLKPLTVNTA